MVSKVIFFIQGTLQMTGHSQRRRHSSDDWAHSQRCGYSSILSSSLVFRPLPLENFWHPVDDGVPGQWCGHSSDQGTLQMTGHRQGRRHSSDKGTLQMTGHTARGIGTDRKSVVKGKSVNLGGRRRVQKKREQGHL